MPYKGENGAISMFIFLAVFTTINNFLEKLTAEMLDEILNREIVRLWVDLKLPKISLEQKFDLMPVNIII